MHNNVPVERFNIAMESIVVRINWQNLADWWPKPIGDPKGRALIAAGVAERSSEPLDPEQDDIERVRQKARERQGGRPLWDDPGNKLQAKRRDRSAAIAGILKAEAAKGRCSTLRRKPALPNVRKSKTQTPVELLVEAGQTRRK